MKARKIDASYVLALACLELLLEEIEKCNRICFLIHPLTE